MFGPPLQWIVMSKPPNLPPRSINVELEALLLEMCKIKFDSVSPETSIRI